MPSSPSDDEVFSIHGIIAEAPDGFLIVHWSIGNTGEEPLDYSERDAVQAISREKIEKLDPELLKRFDRLRSPVYECVKPTKKRKA